MDNILKTTALLGFLTGLFLLVGNMLGGQQGMIMGLMFAAVMNFGTYFFSDKIVLAQYGAKEADRNTFGDLYALVRRLATRAELPMPRLFVLDMPTPNAFATGRNAAHAVVAVSPALMKALSTEELEGVLAHELGHIKNGDMFISTLAATLAGAISYLANIALYWGPLRSRDDDRGSSPISMLLIALVTPIAATLLHLAISRTREFAADEYAGRLTHRPRALAAALQKIAGVTEQYPLTTDAGHRASAHLFIINPFNPSFLSRLFSTHPPVQERVARLTTLKI